MVFQRASALALLVLCSSLTAVLAKPTASAQLAPGIIPIPDDPPAPAPARPTALRAATPSAIGPAATAAAPAGFSGAFPGFGAAAAAPGPAAAGFGAFPAQPGFPAPAAQPGFAAPAAQPGFAVPAQPGFAAPALPTAAFPGAASAFPGAAGGFPGAAAGFPGAAPGFPGAASAFPGAASAFPGAAAGFPGFPGAMPGAMPGLAGAFGPQLPPGLISNPLPAVPAPPPRARPAAPPAPPIPNGRAVWKPQWDELKDFTDNEVIISFNVANTPEQVYWNQKKVKDALAKAGGILPNSISYYQVLPSTDDYGRPFTTVRFVVQNRNSDLASNLMTSLNAEGTQTKLKNRIEELNLDLIGDSMKAQTPTDFKAASRGGASSALPSSTMMDTSGGMNGAGAINAAATAPTGLGMPKGAGGGLGLAAEPAGNATSTAGLPGAGTMGSAGGQKAMTRRVASGALSAAVSSWLLAAAVAAGALLL